MSYVKLAFMVGDVPAYGTIVDRDTGVIYANKNGSYPLDGFGVFTGPTFTLNGEGLYLDGARTAVSVPFNTPIQNSTDVWFFIQNFLGTSDLFLTKATIYPPTDLIDYPTFSLSNVTLAGLTHFARHSATSISSRAILFVSEYNLYSFSTITETASIIFTSPTSDGPYADAEKMHLSNISDGYVLCITQGHLYEVNVSTGALGRTWTKAFFGQTADFQRAFWDRTSGTVWLNNDNLFRADLATGATVTLATGAVNASLVYNAVTRQLVFADFSTTTIKTVGIDDDVVTVGTTPGDTGSWLGVDSDGYIWTPNYLATFFACKQFKLDPLTFATELSAGADAAISIGQNIARSQEYGFGDFANWAAIGHGVNANAYANGGSLDPQFPPGNGLLAIPQGNGLVVDGNSLDLLHAWCRANGISVALNQDSQRAAKDLLDELTTIGNSACVYSGDTLHFIPYDEVSNAGYGAVYTAPTAGGPVAHLTDKDFVAPTGNEAPVQVKRKRRANCDNVVSIEHINRDTDYVHMITSEPCQSAVAQYGPRKGGTLDAADLGLNIPSGSKSLLTIQSKGVAQKISSILSKRGGTGPNTFTFKLKADRFVFEAMDFVDITDTRSGLSQVPCRFTSVKEQEDHTLDCEAEQFMYGLNHPDILNTTTPTGTLVSVNVDPGVVQTPIIFQPYITQTDGVNQIWIAVWGSDPSYGGCIVFLSVDGGTTYNPIGPASKATAGVLTATFASGSDPDTTHTLAVNLTTSAGSLSTQPQATADTFANPCYVESTSPAYEIVCPTVATLTSTYHYNLATYIRRGVDETAIVSHASGKNFIVLDGNLFKINTDPSWIGLTLFFKFAAFNTIGGQQNDLSACTPYTFTPVDNAAVRVWVSMNPAIAVSQGAGAATTISMAAFDVTTAGGTLVHYNSRTFTISDPGSTPTVYYVTIYDPTFIGDSAGTLTSFCETTRTKADTPGYSFAGKIIATHAGGNTGGPGGPGGADAILILVT